MFQKVVLIMTILLGLTGSWAASAKSKNRAVAQDAGLRWSPTREICVFYDYRTMIQDGGTTDLFFAIEPQNYNGGSREFSYRKKDFKTVKEAYLKAFSDLNSLMQTGRCDSFSIFYPSSEKPDAPM